MASKKSKHPQPEPSQAEESESAKSREDSSVGTRFSADEIHENIIRSDEDEMDRPMSELALSALASGLSIGFRLSRRDPSDVSHGSGKSRHCRRDRLSARIHLRRSGPSPVVHREHARAGDP